MNLWAMRGGEIFDTDQVLMPGWEVVAKGAFEGAPGEQDLLWRDGAGNLTGWSFGVHANDVLIV